MSNSEQGIFQAQARAASATLDDRDGLQRLQRRNIFYLDERVYVYLFSLVMVGLFILWVTSKSGLLIYGSLIAGILLIFTWGFVQIEAVERRRRRRELEARTFEAAGPPRDKHLNDAR